MTLPTIKVRCDGPSEGQHERIVLAVKFVQYPPDVDAGSYRWKFDNSASLGGSGRWNGEMRSIYDTPTNDPRSRHPRWVPGENGGRGYGHISCWKCDQVARITGEKFQKLCDGWWSAQEPLAVGVSYILLRHLVGTMTR